MNIYEFTNQIYDTLMHNTDYPQLNLDLVTDCWVDEKENTIFVEYCGKQFMWQIVEV